MPKLVHTKDGRFIEDIVLKEGQWLIGRRPECDISLDDTTVSGKHALLVVSPSKYMKGLLDVHLKTSAVPTAPRSTGRRSNGI